MIKEEFTDGNSLLHQLDPRIKILAATLFSVVVALTFSLSIISMAILFCIGLLFLAKLDPKKLIKRVIIVNTFIFLLWLFLPFTYPGQELFSIGPLSATLEGITYTLFLTIKSNVIIISCIALLSTSSIFSLVHALNHLHCPQKLIQIFFFNYRYVHVLYQEYLNMRKTLKVRCFKPKTNLRTYKTIAHLIAMLLIKSYERAEKIYKAMLCRGFKGRFYVLGHFSLTLKDIAIGTIMFLFIVGMIICEWIPKCL